MGPVHLINTWRVNEIIVKIESLFYYYHYYFNLSLGETRTLPRSSSMAAGLEKNGRSIVQAIFSHAAGDNSTLLSFTEGDIITLLVPEARDGWHYGENDKNKM